MLLFCQPRMRFGRAGVLQADLSTAGGSVSPLANDLPSLTDRASAQWLWALIPPLPGGVTTEVRDDGYYGLVSPPNGSYSQTYRGLVMPQSGAVEVYESTISTTVGATSVTLVIDDTVHYHIVDNADLTSQTVLAIDNTLHNHTVDSVNLSIELSLTIADTLHSHYVDNVVLSNAPILIIDDALHSHYVSVLTLNTDTWLFIQNAMHAHSSNNVILTFGGVGTSALVTGAVLVDRKFVASMVNARIVGQLFDRLDS